MGHWWHEQPWRHIQTNLREIDMKDIDAKEYVRQLQEFGATVVMINTGGIIASYESKVEDHTPSDYLTGDSLKTIMEECHKAGIKVLARMDFSKARKTVYDKHPEWAYRLKDGGIINYNGDVHMCFCSGYQQEKVFEIMRETIETLPIDGVFINMGGFQQNDYSFNRYEICHCDNCKKLFKEQFGFDLPDKEDMDDLVFRKYKIFQKRMLKTTNERMRDMIKSINPELAFDGFDFERCETNTEYKNSEHRPRPHCVYNSSSIARCETALRPGVVCSNASVDYLGFFYRHSSVGAHIHELRMSQDLANYVGLDFFVMSRLDNHRDRSGYARVKKMFKYMADNDAHYKDMIINGDTLLIRPGSYAATEEACGWVHVLTGSHILFEESDPENIKCLEDIKEYNAVIVSHMPTISEELASIIDAYVEEGGCLIMTGQTGRYDENGEERANIAFESIGASRVKYYSKEMRSAIFEIGEEDKELLPSLAETEVLYFGDEYWYVDYDETVEKHLHLIPPHSYGPPERCYYTQVTNLPGFTVNAFGRGKAVQIPWMPGELYHKEGYDSTFFLMKDILINIAGLKTVQASPFTPMVEVTLGYAKDRSRAMVHLVNTTGHFGNTYFSPVDVYDIKLKVVLDREPVKLFSLIDQHEITFEWKDGCVYFDVERLGRLEAINILF